MIKIAILQFPGSNCEIESSAAVKRAGMQPVEFLWNGDYSHLKALDGYVIVGGFSYEDRSRAGVIASLDPVMEIIRQESEKGKPVLGICNGAQILVETGMVPALPGYRLGMALAPNRREKDGHLLGTGYYNEFTHLKMGVNPNSTAFTRHLESGEIIKIPLAHAEGRYVIPDPLLREMVANDQTPFQYCDSEGRIEDSFPTNPNGSALNLAAVTNPRGNVMAIMPHPERVLDGDPIFSSMRSYIESGYSRPSATKFCAYERPEIGVDTFAPQPHSFELLIDLIITDNTALSVQKALQVAGIKAGIARKTHWEVSHADGEAALRNSVIQCGELFNSNKEYVCDLSSDPSTIRILVHDHEDFTGKQKLETLRNRFHLNAVSDIRHSTLWEITLPHSDNGATLQKILDTHILWNPFYQSARYYPNPDVNSP